MSAPVDPGVMTTAILAMQAVILGVIGLVAKAIESNRRETRAVKREASAARVQVENDHTTNMREDMDRYHEQVMDELHDMRVIVTRNTNRIDRLEAKQ